MEAKGKNFEIERKRWKKGGKERGSQGSEEWSHQMCKGEKECRKGEMEGRRQKKIEGKRWKKGLESGMQGSKEWNY